jgi:hypothetical protein
MTNRKAGFLMFLIFAAFLIVSKADRQDLVAEEFRYCTEVVIWDTHKMTDGSSDYGHPDYKGIYDDVCKELEPHDQP